MRLTTTTNAIDLIEWDGVPIASASTSLVGRLINLYSLDAERLMNRTVTAATYTEYLDVEPRQTVFSLKAYPVTAFSSVVADASREFTSGTVATTNYSATTSNGMIRIDYHYVEHGFGALRVIYAGGMATATATFITNYPDIADAVAQQVAYHWSRRKDVGRTSVNDGRGNVAYTAPIDWLPFLKEVILRHRRVTYGR